MIIWPKKILKPQKLSVDLAPRSLRTSAASSGFTQVVSNSAGIWRAEFNDVPIYSPSMILLWRAIANQAEGMLNPIVIPVFEDYTRIPLPLELTSKNPYPNEVTHDDDMEHDDDTLYEGNYVEVRVAENALTGATTLTVLLVSGSELQPGQRFSIDNKLYEINSITSQNGQDYVLKIRPPLREDVDLNQELNFDNPTCEVRLASDNEMWLPLNFNQHSFPTINFIENV